MSEKFDKSDAYKILDTINMWINNCDTKASIMIAAMGIVTTMLCSTDIFNFVSSVIFSSLKVFSGWMIVYNIVIWLSIISMMVGIVFLICVIMPKIITTFATMNDSGNTEKETYVSYMFYGSIAKKNLFKDFDTYYSEVESISDEQIIKDLCYQIYSASIICNRKFNNFKKGLFFVFGGFLIFVLQMIIYNVFIL